MPRTKFAALWEIWIRFAKILGTIQMTIILSIVFFVIIGFMYLPFKLIADPMRLKSHGASNWRKRVYESNILESMKNQY